MPSDEELNRRFGIPGIARIEAGGGGLAKLVIDGPAAAGELYLHGAHVTQYQPRGKRPVLFLSPKSFFEDGKPIRGGVPVIFPWFGPHAEGVPMHGFARTRAWAVERVAQDGDRVIATLTLRSDEKTRAIFPHDFELRFTAAFGPSLEMTLEVKNTGADAMRFEEALHTYFAIGDVRQISIDGLGGADYLDKTQDHRRLTQTENPLRLAGTVDRVYVGTGATCVIDDPAAAGGARRITVAKRNSDVTVVWNPWSDKIANVPDFDAADWPGFVCVETCNVKDHALTLPPGATHAMAATIGTT